MDVLERAYRRLDSLEWAKDENSADVARTLPLSDPAADVFEQWQHDNAALDDDTSSLYKSFVGKMDGTVLRLALVSELVRWAFEGGAEPGEVSADSLIAAAGFVDDYAKPMAERVYGDAALPQVERLAAVLARYIVRQGFRTINKRELKQSPHKAKLPGLRSAETMDRAIEFLVDSGWLHPMPSREGDRPGMMKADFMVNPAVHGARA